MSRQKKPVYKIETSEKSSRKYPNVIWFPRSKTDPREIREVLKLALKAQEENPKGFFNDKTLGKVMALIGSISVIGFGGEKYIESYKDKSIGDVSYITNARMLMRLFRFLGLVTRRARGEYVLTDLGKLYCSFSGDFPDFKNGISEEKMLLDSLSNFGFYCVNDDSTFRDARFRIRPFIWLLYGLSVEPQCIFQLIATTFASQAENVSEVKRIRLMLYNLQRGSTNLKKEWKKLGLDPNDYSCVHNFYDSAKILVYLGTSLGLITKISNAIYGKKITGGARHLKQSNTFYTLTDKGRKFIGTNLPRKLVYYDKLYEIFGDDAILDVSILLASLNYEAGNIKVYCVKKDLFRGIKNIEILISKLKTKFGIRIDFKDDYLSLNTQISFSFYQSIPPEILNIKRMRGHYKKFMVAIHNNKDIKIFKEEHSPTKGRAEYAPYFELDGKRRYAPEGISPKDLGIALEYSGKEDVFGGSDRFSSRVSPTNSVVLEDDRLYVNNSIDALDLLVPLRIKDKELARFIEKNTTDLVDYFVKKSDTWEKDQHYTWVRNCFRHFGMEAKYSGSSGMLSRADISIINPFLGGAEAKSPRENRGTLNLKAIRQAVDAKVQVVDQFKDKSTLPMIGMAIGRRVSDLAIKEERKWAKQHQPVLLLNDVILYYLVIKSATVPLSLQSITNFFTLNHGLVNRDMVKELFSQNTKESATLEKIDKELDYLAPYLSTEV